MKNKQYRLVQMGKSLKAKEASGVPYVIWKLSEEQREYVERKWSTEPFLYSIKTRYFKNVHKLQSVLLRDLHYECKRGKVAIVRALSMGEKRMLDEFGINYRPIKYKIYLKYPKIS